jgi:hypothetical protein
MATVDTVRVRNERRRLPCAGGARARARRGRAAGRGGGWRGANRRGARGGACCWGQQRACAACAWARLLRRRMRGRGQRGAGARGRRGGSARSSGAAAPPPRHARRAPPAPCAHLILRRGRPVLPVGLAPVREALVLGGRARVRLLRAQQGASRPAGTPSAAHPSRAPSIFGSPRLSLPALHRAPGKPGKPGSDALRAFVRVWGCWGGADRRSVAAVARRGPAREQGPGGASHARTWPPARPGRRVRPRPTASRRAAPRRFCPGAANQGKDSPELAPPPPAGATPAHPEAPWRPHPQARPVAPFYACAPTMI